MMKRILVSAATVLLFALTARAADRPPDIKKVIETMQASYAGVSSYHATLVAQARIGEALGAEQTIDLLFEKPNKMLMRWTGVTNHDQEVLFENGKVHGRRGGLLSFIDFTLDPKDPHVLKESPRPLTEIGLGPLVGRLAKEVTAALDDKSAALKTSFANWNDARCVKIDIAFDATDPECHCSHATIYLTPDTQLPAGYFAYDDSDELVERYEYKDIQLNVTIPPDRFHL